MNRKTWSVRMLAAGALLASMALPMRGQLQVTAPAQAPGASIAQSGDCWLKTPTVSVMTGFIYEPLKPYTIQKWMENLGNKFDAEQWVKDFKETGATHMVFYDKWIDGLVFHDTKTTNFKTKKDFVRELAAACQRQGLKLVIYFNAVSDGNPEFAEWATRDKQGKPIVFGAGWPTPYQTQHSPFHQKCLEQVRELLTNYGPIDGLWHDIFNERLNTSSPWVAQGYEKVYGEPFDKASPRRLVEFNVSTLASYLDEVYALRRELKQNGLVITANGSGMNFLNGGKWTDAVGARLHYLFMEGHAFEKNDALARLAWVLPKPLDVNLLLTKSWFTPLEDTPPPAKYNEKQAIAATAITVCQGAGVNWALTPGHDGVYGDDLKHAKLAGAWFRKVKPLLEGARPYADVGVVLGTLNPGGAGLAAANGLWQANQGRTAGAWNETVELVKALERQGLFSRILYLTAQGGSWPDSLAELKAVIVPEQAPLDDAHLEQLRRYVAGGGKLIAFGHATQLDGQGVARKDYGLADVLGARLAGEVEFPATIRKSTIQVDSEWGHGYTAENLLTGKGEGWSSAGTAMPHWIEVTLPRPVEAARIEVVNRKGSYQICDFEIEARDGEVWKTIKSVRNAKGATILVTLEPPVTATKLRVKFLREEFRGGDRQIADLKALRITDKEGRNWIGGRAAAIALKIADTRLGMLFDGTKFPAQAVRVEQAGAAAVATLQGATPAPAILRNAFGKGEAWLIATGDGAIDRDSPLWRGVARLAAGEPTLQLDPADALRYRVILTKVAGGHALHVIDTRVNEADYRPKPLSIALAAERLGSPRQAFEAGSDAALKLNRRGGLISFTLQPDPVASVMLK